MVDHTTEDTLTRARVMRSTISNYIGKFLALGTWFFLTPFLLAQLGDQLYGLWVLAGSIVAYGSLLDFGIAGALIKYVAEYRARGEHEQLNRLVATTLRIYITLGLSAIGLALLIVPFFDQLFRIPADQLVTARWLVALMGLGVGLSIPCVLPNAILRGMHRFDLVNLISTSGLLLSAGLTVIVLLLGGNIIGLVIVNICVTLAMQVPSIRLIRRIAPELRLSWRGGDRGAARQILSFSWSLFVIDLSTRLQTKTDEVVIGVMLPLSVLTPYALARKLSETAQLLTEQFLKLLLPLASELHAQDDKPRLRQLYLTSTRLSLVLFVPVGLILVILAGPILTVWVGAQYATHATLVAILTCASLIVTSQWAAVSILQGMARHRLLAWTSLASGVAYLALSIVLAPHFGIVGIALGTLIPVVIECLLVVLPYSLHTIGVTLRQFSLSVILPALLPALPMITALLIGRKMMVQASLPGLALISAVALLLYLVVYLRFGASVEERRLGHTLLRQIALLTQLGPKRT
jgi:O-antigen/teichoic acid export membrane protein